MRWLNTIFYFAVVFLLIPDESDAARWVDANLRARESVHRRREMNYLERRSIDEIDMSVDELLLLTEGELRFWYFSPFLAMKAQACLLICTETRQSLHCSHTRSMNVDEVSS